MTQLKQNPITTKLGLMFVVIGFILLFIILFFDTKKDLHLWHIGIMEAFGVLLIISKDDVKDVIKTFFTLGINKLLGGKTG